MKKALSLILCMLMLVPILTLGIDADAPTPYGVWVGDTEITSANCDDVFGDGTVSYKPSTYQLTLTNFTYSGAGYRFTIGTKNYAAAIYSNHNIKVVISGLVTISCTATDVDYCAGIWSQDSVDINGYGEATFEGTSASAASYGIYAADDVHIYDIRVDAYAGVKSPSTGYAIYAGDTIYLDSTHILAYTGESGPAYNKTPQYGISISNGAGIAIKKGSSPISDDVYVSTDLSASIANRYVEIYDVDVIEECIVTFVEPTIGGIVPQNATFSCLDTNYEKYVSYDHLSDDDMACGWTNAGGAFKGNVKYLATSNLTLEDGAKHFSEYYTRFIVNGVLIYPYCYTGSESSVIVFSNGKGVQVAYQFDRLPNNFSDVNESKWYFDAVVYNVENMIMSGTSATTFSPSSVLTRAQIATIIGNLAYVDHEHYAKFNSFDDVPSGKWYHDAVEFCYAYGITKGTGYRTYNPNGQITRQELAVLLYNFVKGYYEIDITVDRDVISDFSDKETISSWAVDAMCWAVENRLITGSGGKLMPKGTATRAQTAQIMMGFYMYINSFE